MILFQPNIPNGTSNSAEKDDVLFGFLVPVANMFTKLARTVEGEVSVELRTNKIPYGNSKWASNKKMASIFFITSTKEYTS